MILLYEPCDNPLISMRSTENLTASRPVVKEATVALPFRPMSDMHSWGLGSDQIGGADTNHKLVTEVEVAGRPSNMIFRATNRAPWWTYYRMMDFYRSEVSILDTIISRSVTELFRYGIDFEPAFVKKCIRCGHEYQNNVSVCPYCNSTKLVRPDESQKDYFCRPDGTSFIDEVNENGQTLKDLCRMYADSQYQNNAGFIIAITGDVVDAETKHLEKSYPLEFICVDPSYARMLYDNTAEPGNLYGFTMDNRKSLISLSLNPKELNTRTPDGKVIYPAYWQIGDSPGASGEAWAYTKDEVYSNHWFRQTMIYGVPPWFSIEDDILTYHYIEKHNLKKYKYGYVRKILVFPGLSNAVMEQVARGVQDVLSKNDNSIPIVGLPPQPAGTGEIRAQTLELGTESSSDLMQIKNDIRDRLCAHIGVPNLFVGDVVGSGGLNNESQQITTFDRYLMDKYDYCDDLLDWILSWFPKITDWKLRVVRPSKGDQENKRLLEQIQVAQGFKNLGFGIVYSNGEFSYTERPIDGTGATVNTEETPQYGRNDGVAQDTEQQSTIDEVDDAMSEVGDQITASKDRITAHTIRGLNRIRKADTPLSHKPYGYLKGMSDEQFGHYIESTTKDVYGFLRHNKEHIAEVLMVGYDVKDVFTTCTPDQVRQIYISVIEILQEPKWSLKDIEHAVMQANPDFSDYYENDATAYKVERIARTEMNRILMYAKEQTAMQDGELDKRYAWRGPLDSRTTPMCLFLQTGNLDAKYEHLRSELPEWREDGWTLPELKDVCRQVWEVFHSHGYIRTEMPSDWSMHINCRHSFSPISTIPDDEAPTYMDNWIQIQDAPAMGIADKPAIYGDWSAVPDGEGDLAVMMDGTAILGDMTDSEDVYVEEHAYPITFGLRYSKHGMPAYYLYENDDSDEPIYVFDSVDEDDIFRYTNFIVSERSLNLSDYDISWALRDEGITGDDVNQLMDNADVLLDMATRLNWGY